VVQARCASERLPNKVLTPLGDRTVVEHVLRAVSAARLVDEVILATSVEPSNDRLTSLVEALGYRVFRGAEDDVLGRFVGALAEDPADVVIRHTADDPLLDPGVIDVVVGAYLKGGCDYASNILQRSWPRGLDTEVVSRQALERAHRAAKEPEYREHVTLYIRRHGGEFRLRNVSALEQETWPDLRLCIDTAEDKALLEAVFAALHRPRRVLRVGEVIDWLRSHPHIARLNAEVRQRQVFGKAY